MALTKKKLSLKQSWRKKKKIRLLQRDNFYCDANKMRQKFGETFDKINLIVEKYL